MSTKYSSIDERLEALDREAENKRAKRREKKKNNSSCCDDCCDCCSSDLSDLSSSFC